MQEGRNKFIVNHTLTQSDTHSNVKHNDINKDIDFLLYVFIDIESLSQSPTMVIGFVLGGRSINHFCCQVIKIQFSKM